MELVDHDEKGAVLRLEQCELLMLMALVQEGRDSFECTAQIGRDLDALVGEANMLVEQARRASLGIRPLGHRLGTVVVDESIAENVAETLARAPRNSTKKVAH